jgi:hypothetical protein
MFVKSMTWYKDPAAPCATPALACRSRVAQPSGPAGADCAGDDPATACGDCDPDGAADDDGAVDGAGDDGADAEDDADDAEEAGLDGGAEDDPPDEHPAAAATTAPAATTPPSLNNEAEPNMTNYPFLTATTPLRRRRVSGGWGEITSVRTGEKQSYDRPAARPV